MLQQLLAAIRNRWIVWTGAQRLSRLDDRLLADMGVARKDIPRFVRGELRCAEEQPAPRDPMSQAMRRGTTSRRALAYLPRSSALAARADCLD
jgi:uncharacterized protein YjiS (DUF1127 family)